MWVSVAAFKSGTIARGRDLHRALTCRLPTPQIVFSSRDIAVLSRKPREGHSDRRQWARERRFGSSTPAASSKFSMSAGSAFAESQIHRKPGVPCYVRHPRQYPPASNRAEERLQVTAVPEFPPATPGIAQDELVEEVAVTVRQTLELHPEVLIATDGSSKKDIGGFGVIVHTPMQVHSSGDGSEDQDPFRQELLAIGLVFKALAFLGLSQVRGSVRIPSDCKAAMHCAFCGRSDALPGLAYSVWTDLCIAEAHGFKVHSLWVPAHGRHLRWKPAIRITGVASERLHNHLRTLGLRKGEPPLPGQAL